MSELAGFNLDAALLALIEDGSVVPVRRDGETVYVLAEFVQDEPTEDQQ
jgi:hypothetical protein